MTTLWIILGLAGTTGLAGFIAVRQRKRITALQQTLDSVKRANDMLREKVSERNHTIKRMEEANAKAQKDHNEIRSGSNRDRFDASKRILSDDDGGDTGG